MAQSREQLTMDMSKSDSMFSRPTGCHVSRAKGFGLLLLFLLGAVAVAYVTYHFSSCSPDLLQSPSANETEGSSSSSKVRDVRLPTTLRPLYYKVDLVPYVDPAKNFTIDGTVRIDILCLEDTDRITIHSKNITVNTASVTVTEKIIESNESATSSGPNLSIRDHKYDIPREFYNVSLGEMLKAGKTYQLYIKFQAILSDELAGFYRSSYTDKTTNETR